MSLSSAQRATIQFLSIPKDDRSQTEVQFCTTIGITARTLQRWQKEDREFRATLEKARKAYAESPDYYALCVRRKALALIDEGLAMPLGTGKGQLSSSERRQYIAAALAETKMVSDSMDTIDRSHLTDYELVSEFIARNVGALGSDVTALIEALDVLQKPYTEGESCTNSQSESFSAGALCSLASSTDTASASTTDCPPSV